MRDSSNRMADLGLMEDHTRRGLIMTIRCGDEASLHIMGEGEAKETNN